MRIAATCLTGLACSVVVTSVFAQGQINWNNTASTLISVYENGGVVPVPVRVSPETTYHFGLFIAPLGTPVPTSVHDPNWQFAGAYASNSAAVAGRIQSAGTATIPGYAAGTNVNFIVRAWQSGSGSADWPAANQSLGVAGQSAMGTATLGGLAPGGGLYPNPMAFGSLAGQIGSFYFGCLGCDAPDFILNPSNQVVRLGDNVTLTVSVSSNPSLYVGYAWRKQFVPIAGATNSYLTLTNVTLADAGNYDVIASHLSPAAPQVINYGSAASAVATVTVLVPAQLGPPSYTINNQFQFTVTGLVGSNYVVQVATNLSATTTWVSLLTNTSPFTFVESNAENFSQRFYRAQAR